MHTLKQIENLRMALRTNVFFSSLANVCITNYVQLIISLTLSFNTQRMQLH